jgi:hypothetical protein
MKPFALALLAWSAVLASPAQAQHHKKHQASNSQNSSLKSSTGTVSDDAAPPPGPMSLDDAVTNFDTVVDNYIAVHSVDGVWSYTDKVSGKGLHLKVLSKDHESIKDAGKGKKKGKFFSGEVTLRDVKSGRKVKAVFLVDFSGADWTVKSLSLLGISVRKKKAASVSKAAPAANESSQ